jgi:hypothetical protein
MAKYNGMGWHKQSVRHSNARKYGKAGGTYSRVDINKLGISQFNKKGLSDYQLQLIDKASSHKTNSRLAGDLTPTEKETLTKLIQLRFPKEASQSYIDEWADRIHYLRAWRSADSYTRMALKKANPYNFPLEINQYVLDKNGDLATDGEIMKYFANPKQAKKEGYILKTRSD